ncbi:hypothetical protein [Clostridium tertium]
MKRKESLLFKKVVARRLKLRILTQKRLKNGDLKSKCLAEGLTIYINLDKELLNSLKSK